MDLPKLDRRSMLKSMAGVSAAGMFSALMDPNSVWAQSGRPIRARCNRTILSTDPGVVSQIV